MGEKIEDEISSQKPEQEINHEGKIYRFSIDPNEALRTIDHPQAARVTIDNKDNKNGYSWITFRGDGSVLGRSESVTGDDIEYAKTLLPADLDKEKKELRDLARQEAERWGKDENVSKPTPKHSKFIGGCSKQTRESLAQQLNNLGYKTAEGWYPYCIQDGPDTHSWILVPPTIPEEKDFYKA